jgi:hypothetical protein
MIILIKVNCSKGHFSDEYAISFSFNKKNYNYYVLKENVIFKNKKPYLKAKLEGNCLKIQGEPLNSKNTIDLSSSTLIVEEVMNFII